jgi:hypothetical protein
VTYDVPFIENTGDALHCQQAAYMMILKYFKPGFEVDWDEWSKITGFEEGKGTWATASLLWFHDQGFAVSHIELFDWSEFARTGNDYMIKKFGEEVGQWSIDHSNIPLEQARGKQFAALGIDEQHVPTIDDIKQFLTDGYLVRALINSHRLNGQDGYFGHAVVVTGFDDNNLILHNPGPPPAASQKVSFADFEAAWADTNEESKEMDAIRLSSK